MEVGDGGAREEIVVRTCWVLYEMIVRHEAMEGGAALSLRFEDIGALLPTARHLFIARGNTLLIVPAAAFEPPDSIEAMADAIDGAVRARRTEPEGHEPAPLA